MSIFLGQGFLRAQYFNAKYLSGGNEGQSGWRRLIISQLQEAANRKADKKLAEAANPKPLTSVVIPPEEKPKKHIKRKLVVEHPEEEIAKDVLKTLKKPIYRGPEERPRVSEVLQIVLQHSRLELSSLWGRLGVTAGLVDNPITIPAATQGEESDDETLLFLCML